MGKELRHDNGNPVLYANGVYVIPGDVVKESPSANFGDNYDPYWRAVVVDRIPHRDDGAVNLVAYRLDGQEDTRSGGDQCWQWTRNLHLVSGELAPESVVETYRSLVGEVPTVETNFNVGDEVRLKPGTAVYHDSDGERWRGVVEGYSPVGGVEVRHYRAVPFGSMTPQGYGVFRVQDLVTAPKDETEGVTAMTDPKITQVEYRRLVSRDFNNETVGAVAEVPTGEDPKEVLHRLTAWVNARLGEEPSPPAQATKEDIDAIAEKVAGIISRRLTTMDLPF